MAAQISIDIETLGTNVDSAVLSIGACTFNAKGEIIDKFYVVVDYPDNRALFCTLGTLKFWLDQPKEARNVIFCAEDKQPLYSALKSLSDWVKGKGKAEIWANGTKFDLGMLEANYTAIKMQVPWQHNADRCMRTLLKFAGNLDVDYIGISHYALDDAIWQAKYIALACKKLGLKL